MDPFLLQEIDKLVPKVNNDIAEGLSYKMMMGTDPNTGMNNTRTYIDKLFEINKTLFPEGFEYLGNRVCAPDQHFYEITKEYGGRRIGNIAKNDVYMIELLTSFKGEPLDSRRILIPFIREGGLCHINGALYSVSPVLTDVGFSVVNGGILIPFGRTKVMVRQVDHHYYCDGNREVTYVVWSQIHNEMSKRTRADLDNRVRIETSIPQYFFCQFGLIETFKQWANADLTLVPNKEVEKYSKTHVIYQSIALKGKHPAGDIALAIPRNQDSPLVKRLIAGVFYVVDTFADRFVDINSYGSKELWQLILGFMIFGDFKHQGQIAEDVESHLKSFNKYLDEITQSELRAVGIQVDNIWELMHSILTELVHHFYNTDIDETSMYGKRLRVLEYVMSELNYAVSMFSYTLQSRRDRPWEHKDLNDLVRKHFKLMTCVRRLSSSHGEFEIVSYPGDNKLLKLTSLLVPQDRARTTRSRNRSFIDDETRLIHASIAEVGQYKNQPKNNPDGRGRVNPFLDLDENGLVKPNPKFKDLIKQTQNRFKGR